MNDQIKPSTLADHPFVFLALKSWDSLPVSGQVFVAFITLLLTVVAVGALVEAFKGPVRVRHVSGARQVSWRQLAKRTADRDKKRRHLQIMLGQVPWPVELEDKHALIVGTTGMGKSTLIRQLLSRIRVRGERAIVVDLNGDFAKGLLTQGDKLFNPFDKRSLRWNPLAEIREDRDISTMLQAMIPEGATHEDEVWRVYARQFLKTLMTRLREEGELRMERLRYYSIAAGDKEVAAFLQGGSNPTRMQDNNMVSTTKSLVKICIEALEFAPSETDFSIQEWVRHGKGFIFITPKDNERTAIKPLLNAFMNLAVIEARSPRDGQRNKPIALVIDELSSFEFDDLQGVLEKGRKFKLVAYAGIQNAAQLRQKYGIEGAKVLMSCFLTKIVFNPGDADTGDDMSHEIGEHVVERLDISHTTSSKGGSTTTKTWRRSPPEPLVLPIELRQLHPLQAYLQFTGHYPVAKITVRY